MMRKSLMTSVLAVLTGFVIAAAGIYIFKPWDTAMQMPGEMRPLPTPPHKMLVLGDDRSQRMIHLVLNGFNEENKEAYLTGRAIQKKHLGTSMNIIAAVDQEDPLFQAFAWALAASHRPEEQILFIEALFGTSGEITPKVLAMLAKNSGLDPKAISEKAALPMVSSIINRASQVFPPALPAIFIADTWITGPMIADVHSKNMPESSASMLVATDAYAFATAPSAKTGAVFLTVRNVSKSLAKIVAARTDIADRVEIHSQKSEGGVMKMRQENEVTVKPDESIAFTPDGLHLMLFDLKAPLTEGQRFSVTLILDAGQEISTYAIVTKPGGTLTDHHHSM